MRYVGNTALSPQIQERIQNTFEQTIGLAEEGNRQEALLGCDFILRLDPLFEPARRLQERLGEGDGPVDVSGLDSPEPKAPRETPEAPEPQPEPVEAVEIPEASVDIGELIADAPDEDPLVGDAPVPAPAPPVDQPPIELTEEAPPITVNPIDELSPLEAVPSSADLATRLAMLFEQRSFRDLMSLAMENKEEIAKDGSLMEMVDAATERLEAEPYVRNFLESAQSAKEKGDLESAQSHMEKARELDPSHPDLPGLEADLETASRVEPPAAFEPPPPVEVPLEDAPPLIEPDAGSDIDGEVDELFPSVEAPAEETAPNEAPTPSDQQEPAAVEPPPVPSLDAEPAARLDSESEQRIEELLTEGQESFEDGQYQAAIDAWSRIFLIDIDHAEASRRIELARKLKAEVERQIEEAFHEGITQLESGDKEKAEEAFNKVLEMQPHHMGAKDYLEKLQSGDLTASLEVPELAPVADVLPDVEGISAEQEMEADLTPTPTAAPPMPGDLAPPQTQTKPKPAPRRKSFALIGSAVMILLLALGWFVYSNWDRFFPASAPEDDTTTTRPQTDQIDRALERHEAGNTAMAISILRRVTPGSEQHAEAQALIANWEAGDQQDDTTSNVLSEEILAKREQLMTQAGQALERGENLLALGLLEEAAVISELTEEELSHEMRATDALELIRDQRELFDQGDWEYALPDLWRMHDEDPANRDVIRLMVNSYFNLGLRDLQRGDANAALEKFEEARDLGAQDEDLARLAQFASAYQERPADMLFRIFVKYQRFR